MRSFQIFSLIGLIVVIVSFMLPWITVRISFSGKYEFNLIDVLGHTSDISQGTSESTGAGFILLSIVLSVSTFIFALIGLAVKQINAVAGALGILSGIIFYGGIGSLKSEIASRTPYFGDFAASLFDVGTGPIVMIVAGTILLVASILRDEQKTLMGETNREISEAAIQNSTVDYG